MTQLTAPPAPADVDGRPAPSALALERAEWQARSRVVLQPVASPSILGFYALALASLLVGARWAGWFGDPRVAGSIEWIPAAAGGLLALGAARTAFAARDAVATVVFGVWGAAWTGYGVFGGLVATSLILTPDPITAVPEIGLWLVVVAAISLVAAAAAAGQALAPAAAVLLLGIGAGLGGAAELAGDVTLLNAGGWVLIGGTVLAFHAASALLLLAAYGRTLLPLGRMRRPADADGRREVALGFELGEPGVRRGA